MADGFVPAAPSLEEMSVNFKPTETGGELSPVPGVMMRPSCSNCPVGFLETMGGQKRRVCKKEPPKLFSMPSMMRTPAGDVPALNIQSAFPPVLDGEVCGEHPILKAEREFLYEQELARLRLRFAK